MSKLVCEFRSYGISINFISECSCWSGVSLDTFLSEQESIIVKITLFYPNVLFSLQKSTKRLAAGYSVSISLASTKTSQTRYAQTVLVWYCFSKWTYETPYMVAIIFCITTKFISTITKWAIKYWYTTSKRGLSEPTCWRVPQLGYIN